MIKIHNLDVGLNFKPLFSLPYLPSLLVSDDFFKTIATCPDEKKFHLLLITNKINEKLIDNSIPSYY